MIHSAITPRRVCPLLAVVASVGLAGCGGDTLAPVSGKVSFQGKPVTGGTLIFAPVPSRSTDPEAGKPASADIAGDGSYTLQTRRAGDGARIGQHHVNYTPPAQQLTEAQRTDRRYIAPPPPFMGLVPRADKVEVKGGPNSIDIELVPAARR